MVKNEKYMIGDDFDLMYDICPCVLLYICFESIMSNTIFNLNNKNVISILRDEK